MALLVFSQPVIDAVMTPEAKTFPIGADSTTCERLTQALHGFGSIGFATIGHGKLEVTPFYRGVDDTRAGGKKIGASCRNSFPSFVVSMSAQPVLATGINLTCVTS